MCMRRDEIDRFSLFGELEYALLGWSRPMKAVWTVGGRLLPLHQVESTSHPSFLFSPVPSLLVTVDFLVRARTAWAVNDEADLANVVVSESGGVWRRMLESLPRWV